MNKLIIPGLSALCVFFLIMWLTNSCDDKPSTPPEDATLWRDKVEQHKGVIKEKDSIIYAIQDARRIEKIKTSKDSTRLTNEATRNFKRYSEAKRLVQELQDSTGRIAAYVSASDSLLAAKDSLYHQEVGHRIAMEKLYQVEVATLGERNVVQKQISQLLETKVTDLQSQNDKLSRRLERKKKGNRLLLGIAAGLGATIAVITLSQ